MSTGACTEREKLTVSVGEKIDPPKEGSIMSINIYLKEDILLLIKASTEDNCQNLILKVAVNLELESIQEGLIVTVDEKIYSLREHSIGNQHQTRCCV
jgi:hypothetical protein